MSSAGHKLTAGAMAATGFILLPLLEGILFAAGCMLGARAPDWLEVVWFRPFRGRQSLIPHRTLTHWPWPWFIALIVLILAPAGGHAAMPIAGFLVGGILHLITDFASPTGVPLLKPLGRRHCLSLYRTGGPGEIVISTAMWALPAVLFLLRKN